MYLFFFISAAPETLQSDAAQPEMSPPVEPKPNVISTKPVTLSKGEPYNNILRHSQSCTACIEFYSN